MERIAAALGEPTGEPVALDGGITNRNFRITFGDGDYVVRVPGKDTSLLGIDRAAECDANRLAAELGVAPPVALMLERPEVIVTHFVEGHPMTERDLGEPAAIAAVAGALRTVHGSGRELRSSFDAFQVVERYAATARGRGGATPDGYESALACAHDIRAALRGPEHEPVPCHNDLLAANFIQAGERLLIVDWEYAGMGDRWFDLGNFAVNNDLDGAAEARLLEAYFGEPAGPGRLATLGLMRFMSDFREAMWGVLQGVVSELDFDFGAYAREHFGRLERTAADPCFAGWLEEARGTRA